jgi:glycosyltransferase involved in cell wall biosynthesis
MLSAAVEAAPRAAMDRPLFVSVVIPNYNYAEFVGEAIESALALDWPHVEVIVVDDGSTDDSRAVIERYGDKITVAFQPNGGQRAACDAGFRRARGDVILFLDSDDRLDPGLVRELVRVWRPGLSKVQFQMKIIDAQGRPTGAVLPQFRIVPTPQQIREWVNAAAAYPTPPGSGNAYARAFVERVSATGGSERASDSYYLAAAPFLGDIVTVPKPLVAYRVHGRNDGAMSELDVARFGVELRRARWRFEYAQATARSVGATLPDRAFDRSLSVLPYRLASLCLAPERHPFARDTRGAVLRDMVRAVVTPQGLTWKARSTLLVWSGLVAASPRRARERLVAWRFVPSSRPQIVRRALGWLGVLGRPPAT